MNVEMMGRLVDQREPRTHRPRYAELALRRRELVYDYSSGRPSLPSLVSKYLTRDAPAMGQVFYTAETAPPEEWDEETRAAAEAAAEQRLEPQPDYTALPSKSPTPEEIEQIVESRPSVFDEPAPPPGSRIDPGHDYAVEVIGPADQGDELPGPPAAPPAAPQSFWDKYATPILVAVVGATVIELLRR